jgi:hypothetical protein
MLCLELCLRDGSTSKQGSRGGVIYDLLIREGRNRCLSRSLSGCCTRTTNKTFAIIGHALKRIAKIKGEVI